MAYPLKFDRITFQEITDAPRYEVPIFANDNGRSLYALAVIFPDKNRYMMSSILVLPDCRCCYPFLSF